MKKVSPLIGSLIAGLYLTAPVHAGSWFEQTSFVQKSASQHDRVLEKISNNKAHKNLQLVTVDEQDISIETDSIGINIRGTAYTLEQAKFEQKGAGTQIWYGRISELANKEIFMDPRNNAIFVRNGNKITGNLRVNGELFKLRPLANGGHALIEVDETLTPADHPDEFALVPEHHMDSRQTIQKGKPGGGNTGTPADPGPMETIRVMVHYTQASANASGDINGLIDLAVAETNTGYQNGGVNINLDLAGKYLVNYNETGNFSTDLARYREVDGVMDGIHTTRDQIKADVGILIVNNTAYCGLASGIGSTSATAFAAVYHDCATGYYSFGHEIGHLQSARHDPKNDPNSSPYAYGHGFQADRDGWRTIMAYNCRRGCTRINYWSNPFNNYSGKSMGTESQSYNTRVLNETKAAIANFKN